MEPLTEHDREVLFYIECMRSLELTLRGREKFGLAYDGPADFLAQHGRFWTPQDLPSTVKPMRVSRCFENAYRLAQSTGWRYVEGFALSAIPVHHAWCVDEHDRVVDPTWASAKERIKARVSPGAIQLIGTSYYGTAFPLDVVSRILISSGMYAVFYSDELEILRRQFEIEIINSDKGVIERERYATRDGRKTVTVSGKKPRQASADLSDECGS